MLRLFSKGRGYLAPVPLWTIFRCSLYTSNYASFTVTGQRTPGRRSGRQREGKGWTASPVDQSQDVQHGGHVWVVVSGGLLQVLQGLFAEGHGHLVPALGGVLDHQVVEGPQAGRDLVAPLLGGGHRGAAVAGLDWNGPERGSGSVRKAAITAPALILTVFNQVNDDVIREAHIHSGASGDQPEPVWVQTNL